MQKSPTARFALVCVLMAAAAGCGGSAKSPTAVNTATGNIAGIVDNNHPAPHAAVITAAQLAARAAVTLDISNGLHSHAVALTAVEVGTIAAGGRVFVTSSTNPHSDGTGHHNHGVTFN